MEKQPEEKEVKGILNQIFGSTSKKLLEKAKTDRIYTIENFVIYLKEQFAKETEVIINLSKEDIFKLLDRCKDTTIEKIGKVKAFQS